MTVPAAGGSGPDLEIVMITGLSGSGKTLAIRAFEDLGYFCVDNLPVTLIPIFADLVGRSRTDIKHVALVVDVRERTFLGELPAIYRALRHTPGHRVRLIFFESDDATLIRRFSETRRPHPLAGGVGLEAGIRREREALQYTAEIAVRHARLEARPFQKPVPRDGLVRHRLAARPRGVDVDLVPAVDEAGDLIEDKGLRERRAGR